MCVCVRVCVCVCVCVALRSFLYTSNTHNCIWPTHALCMYRYEEVFHDFPNLRVIQQDLAHHLADVRAKIDLPAALVERVGRLINRKS